MAETTFQVVEQHRVHTGTTDIDVSAADYTSYQALLTIEPPDGQGLKDVRVAFDLDKATSGWADTGTTETLQLAVSRKVDGTNYRRDLNTETSTVAANAADGDMLEFDIGTIGPDEDVRIDVVLSAEAGDVEIPYVCYYTGRQATFTEVAA